MLGPMSCDFFAKRLGTGHKTYLWFCHTRHPTKLGLAVKDKAGHPASGFAFRVRRDKWPWGYAGTAAVPAGRARDRGVYGVTGDRPGAWMPRRSSREPSRR